MPRRRTRPALSGCLLAAALWPGAPAAPTTAADVSVQHGVGAGGDITAGGSITVGLTPAQVRELMLELQAQDSAAVAKVEELSATLGVTNGAVAAFLRILGEQAVPTEQLAAKLEEIARRHVALLQQLQASGAEDPETKALRDDVARNLNNLASRYRDQGRYGEAESLYRRAIAIDERTLGPDHPGLATALSNLAGLYLAQGRYGDAEPLYERALRIFEDKLGPDHPHTITVRNNYAQLKSQKP